MASKALTVVAENIRFLLFLCGFALLYAGVSSLSRPLANIVAGGLVMGLAALPYLRPRKS